MKKLFLAALIFRLLLSFLTYHPDTLDFLGWSKDIEKNGLSGIYYRGVDDAGPANYPPLYYLYLNFNNRIYQSVKSVLWIVNDKAPLFPSNIFLYFESDRGRIWFNKLTPIIFDLASAYMLYLLIVELADKKKAKFAAGLYLFLPPSWYISSLWGQIDSMYITFLLISLFFFLKRRISLSILFFTVSLCLKPNAIYIFPLFILIILKQKYFKAAFLGALSSFFVVILPSAYFVKSFSVTANVEFYVKYIREISGYISSNAFNIWGIFYGFAPKYDSLKLLGLSVYLWGFIIYLLFMFYVIYKIISKTYVERFIFILLLLCFASFLFLTRMHERYFYMTYVIFLVTSFIYPKIRKYFYITSVVFFLNLYHFWWYPYLDVSKYFFSNRLVEVMFCLINLLVFYKLLVLEGDFDKGYV